MNCEQTFAEDRNHINEWLSSCFNGRKEYARLYESMRYSLTAGGKRIRPVLVLETSAMFGGDRKEALPIACAVEMLHTYSLIHDDLPCMDNDDLRRGKPTNHKLYGEAGALLAGDALLTAAFETITENQDSFSDRQILDTVRVLSTAAGARGMVGGQALDIQENTQQAGEEYLKELQTLKTGALLRASGKIGAILAGCTKHEMEDIDIYCSNIGLAFQIQDDVLDVVSDEETLGKRIKQDVQNNKVTFINILGLDGCRKRISALTEKAIDAVSKYENGEFLIWLAGKLEDRQY